MSDGEPLPVDRVHNLENLLDMYEYNELDVLVNEAIANAVDAFRDHSVKSCKIDISFDRKDSEFGYISFHNNAPPMTEKQFYGKHGYHEVSFSLREKGKGIGFAGVGAKIFLASKQGGEIITITGKGKNDFMASKMFRTEDDVRFMTTQNYSLKEILDDTKYTHNFGTLYRVRVTNYAYRYFKERLHGLIQFWWNYALQTKQMAVTIDGKPLSPWIPRGDKYKKTFTWKRQKIPAICFISKETIPEERQHIVYTVYGKRIYNQSLGFTIRLREDYSNRVFCIVDLSILADQLTANKENFKKSIYTNDCRHNVENNFWKFLEEMGLTTKDPTEPSQQMLKNELTNRLEELFRTKEFNELDPFLTPRKRKTPMLDTDGDIVVSEVPGDGLGEGKGGKGRGRQHGPGDGTAYVEDEDGNEAAKMKERRSRGLHIIYDDGLQSHEEESVVSIQAGGIVIDTNHPFWLRCKKNHVLRNFNEMRVVIEALIKYKNDEVEWDAKETLERYRNLIHKTWI